MDELLGDFLAETNESLDSLDQSLIELEHNSDDAERVNSVFRVFHTIKGTSGFLDLHRLGKVAHAAESLISRFRDHGLAITSERITLVLDALDRIKFLMETIEHEGYEPEGNDDDVIEALKKEVAKHDDTAAENAPEETPAPKAEAVAQTPKATKPKDKAPDQAPDQAPNKAPARKAAATPAKQAAPPETTKETTKEAPPEKAPEAATEAPPEADDESDIMRGEELEQYIDTLFDEDPSSKTTDATDAVEKPEAPAAEATPDEEAQATDPAQSEAESDSMISIGDIGDISQMAADFGEQLLQNLDDEEADEKDTKAKEAKTEEAKTEEAKGTAVANTASAISKPEEAKNKSSSIANKPAARASHPVEQTPTLRVKLDLLESLTNVVSELVLTRNQLSQLARDKPNPEYTPSLQQLNLITSELQEGILKTRMQPIGIAWGKLPRIIRTLSRDLEKPLELRMIGEETEIDRQIIEYIRDPLTHLIRNSADHGIESPAERKALKKPEAGTIILKATNEGGQVIIEITDDGRGIDFDKIRNKAVENGEITAHDAALMSPKQLTNLLFRPGFSTAKVVTAVSGRGVGLDVVRTNLDKIGGNIEVVSALGQGTTTTIKIPLSLSIISGLIIGCQGLRFALPQSVVKEVVGISRFGSLQIETVQDIPVVQLRGRLLPVIELSKALELPQSEIDPNEQYLIICEASGTLSGVLVDKIYTSEEVVVKPLSPILQNTSIYSGNTILGDGDIIMILDPRGLFINSGLTEGIAPQEGIEGSSQDEQQHSDFSYLLFKTADEKQSRLLSLLSVNRIEHINAASIDYPSGRASIQYLGKMMPIIHFDESPLPDSGYMTALIFEREGEHLALVIESVFDIIDGHFDIDLIRPGEKIAGVAIIDDHAVDVVDVDYFFKRYLSRSLALEATPEVYSISLPYEILLVIPDPLLHTKIKKWLISLDARVAVVGSGRAALLLTQQARSFNAIISSQTLPDMRGNHLAKRLRERSLWTHVPIIALTNSSEQGKTQKEEKDYFSGHAKEHDLRGLASALYEAMNPGSELTLQDSRKPEGKSNMPILTLT